MADLTALYADRAALGVTDTLVPSSPLRLGALAAAAAGASRLALDASGNVTAGVLGVGDIPSVFTRRDVAETIAETWTWAPGKAIVFSGGDTPAAPILGGRSTGTRVVVHPGAGGTTEYAIGIENGASWISIPPTAAHKWYSGATERLRLDTDGTLRLLNGSGILALARASDGAGAVAATSVLALVSDTANISFQTGNNLILPTYNFKENLGAIHRKFLTLHAAELWVETLVAQDTMATIGGRILVGPTTYLRLDLPASGAGAAPEYQQGINVKHNNLRVGDYVWMEAGGSFEIMQVVYGPVGVAPDHQYLVWRNRDGSGLRDWYAGDAMFSTGTTGDGFIDLYSVRGVKAGTSAGPTIVGNVRTGATTAGSIGWRERWALGNLKGIYSNTGTLYGVAFGKPDSGLHVQIDDVNGIRFMDGANSAYSSWDMTGAIRIGYPTAPNITISATGAIELRNGAVTTMALEAGTGNLSLTGNLRSGATSFTLGTGYWLGWNGGTPQLRIGVPGGNRVEWDGSNLTIQSGNVQLAPTTGITVSSAPGGLFTPSYGYNLTARALGGTCAMWGWEVGLERKLEITNTTAPLSNGAAAIRLSVLGYGGAGTYGATIDLESYASQLALFRVVCQDVRLGDTLSQTLTFKGGGNQSFQFTPYGGAAGHLLPMTANQDLGDPSHQWRYAWLTTALGIGLGAAVPAYTLQLGTDSAAKTVSSTWQVPSDLRTKHAIEAVDPIAALTIVRQVPIVRYRTNDGDLPAIGVIAQDVAQLLPLSVRARSTDGLLDWNAHELLMLNVAAVQHLADRLAALEGKDRRDS